MLVSGTGATQPSGESTYFNGLVVGCLVTEWSELRGIPQLHVHLFPRRALSGVITNLTYCTRHSWSTATFVVLTLTSLEYVPENTLFSDVCGAVPAFIAELVLALFYPSACPVTDAAYGAGVGHAHFYLLSDQTWQRPADRPRLRQLRLVCVRAAGVLLHGRAHAYKS